MQFPLLQGAESEDTDDISSTQPCEKNKDDAPEVQEIFPRIGPDYQAVIPPLHSSIVDHCQQIAEETSLWRESDDDWKDRFLEGLPVPTMWITVGCSNHKNPFEPKLDNEVSLRGDANNVEVHVGKFENHQSQVDSSALPDNKHCDVDQINISPGDSDSPMADSIDDLPTKVEAQESLDSLDAVAKLSKKIQSTKWHRRKRGRGGWKRYRGAKMASKLPAPNSDASVTVHHGSSNVIMVPGTASGTWSESEEDAFILAMYIFGKNFVAVRKFMESKSMMDIMSYYYGKFYGTDPYCIWAESRKIKSRKCFQGQRIFSGWRQHELSIRLSPYVPDDMKDRFPNVMSEFNEGKTTIEKFVNEIKMIVGLDRLVQAIGIGKGSHDLTTALMDPVKANQTPPTRGEIPIGRACSSLSTEEIVKFLTGDYRLSKARSNDLFWEAVWPRLLASGWHSEQPNDQAKLNSKSSLVFLVPGVQKFSRGLVKGIHYFDCVSEVLNKVSLEPRLLDPSQMKGDAFTSKMKEECLVGTDYTNERNDPLQDQPCYLRPRFCSTFARPYLFTVVDTSLVLEIKEPSQVRESKALPSEDLSEYLQISSEREECSVEEKMEVCEQPDLQEPLNTGPVKSTSPPYGMGDLVRVDSTVKSTSPPYGMGDLVRVDSKLDMAYPSRIAENILSCNNVLLCKDSPLNTLKVEECTSADKEKMRTWDLNRRDDSSLGESIHVDNNADPSHRGFIPHQNPLSNKQPLRDSQMNESDRLDGFAILADVSVSDRSSHIAPSSISHQQNTKRVIFDAYQERFRSQQHTSGGNVAECHQKISPESGVPPPCLFPYADSVTLEGRYGIGPDPVILAERRHALKMEKSQEAEKSMNNDSVLETIDVQDSLSENNPDNAEDQLYNNHQVQCENQTKEKTLNHKVHEDTDHAQGRRQSKRARPLTVKALEAFASGFYSAKKRKGGKNTDYIDDSHIKFFSRQFKDESKPVNKDLASSHNDFTIVDTSMQPVEEENNDGNSDAKPRNRYKKRRKNHLVMKVQKLGLSSENFVSDIGGENDIGVLVSDVGQ